MDPAPTSRGVDDPPARPPSLRRRIGLTLLALLLGPLLVEGGLRLVLFQDTAWARDWGQGFRDASLFTADEGDADYWKLQYRFTPVERRTSPPLHDSRLGWRYSMMGPDLQHRDWDPADTRRPILLYGASFAGCATPKSDCFQGLLERSPLGEEFVLINYGVGGYGLDQAILLFENTIELYADRDPVVLFGPVMESDLDRCSVDFRGWPKPRFKLLWGELREPAPLPEDPNLYLERNPIAIRSYAWRYLLHGTRVLPADLRGRLAGRTQRRNEQRRLIAHLVARIQSQAESRNLDYGFLIFHAQGSVLPGREPGWQERHFVSLLENEQAPFRTTRAALRSAGDVEQLFIRHGRGRNHLDARGNEIVFSVLCELLEKLAYGETTND